MSIDVIYFVAYIFCGGNMALAGNLVDKGAVSVYGMGRFPTTLYYGHWIPLLDVADDLRAFLEAQKKAGKLSLGKD